MGMFSKANLKTSNKQTTGYSSPLNAQQEAKSTQLSRIPEQPQSAPVSPQRMSTNGVTHSSMQAAPQMLQTAPTQSKLEGTAQEGKQNSGMQSAFPLIKLAPIKTKVLAQRSLFSRVRPARHTRAEKAHNKEKGVHLDAIAQEQPQVIYDLQRPLIV